MVISAGDASGILGSTSVAVLSKGAKVNPAPAKPICVRKPLREVPPEECSLAGSVELSCFSTILIYSGLTGVLKQMFKQL